MDGIIVVNKPKDYTSNDVVRKVKKILNEKIGHTGTLDPNATGVLPLLVGKGTLLSKYLINHDKTYEAQIKLGIKTDSADVEGKVIEEREVDKNILTKENVEKVLQCFVGETKQIPPLHSAIKLNGKKLYEYARNGEKVAVEPRKITIYDIELKDIDLENNIITYIVNCSKGTYIRTLCEDIAEKLGTVGYMIELNRLRVGAFDIENSYTIEELEKGLYGFINLETFFYNKESIVLNDRDIGLFFNGVMLTKELKDEVYKIYNEHNDFIGTGTVTNNLLKRDIILK